ncbi:retrovirus-related pol polyprotein from transposon RE1 [Tanacetum coccineum]
MPSPMPSPMPLPMPSPIPSPIPLPTQPPANTHTMTTRAKDGIFKPRHFVDLALLNQNPLHVALLAHKEPKGYKSAAKSSKWITAMKDEMAALKHNDTWDLVPRPNASNVVGSKWVYRIKYRSHGTIDRYKARLVAQGFTHIPGLDYSHTFSPVVKASTVRIVLSLAVLNNWSLHQLDVKNAFLNGNLTETVFMEQPPGFIDVNHQADTSLFVFQREKCLLYLLVYVDDIILTGNNNVLISRFISRLNKEFAIKDLVFTPLSTYANLTINGDLFSDPTLYRSLVGALQYLTITRPDLSYAVNQVSQFLHAPTNDHFQAVKRILRYVKGTMTFGLAFNRSPRASLTAFSDADWARCTETRRSTYRYSIFQGGNLVSWSAKKQLTVSRSSCESEYRALANTASEVVWLTSLLRELQVPLPSIPVLYCDNKSAIFLSQNPVAHKRAKHIDIDYHFVRELVSHKKLSTRFVPSSQQLADIFTKSLPRPLFESFRSKLCVGPPPPRLRGGIGDISSEDCLKQAKMQASTAKLLQVAVFGREMFAGLPEGLLLHHLLVATARKEP